MKKPLNFAARRIAWGLWIAAAGALHWFGNNLGSFVVLLASVAAPVLLGVLAILAAKGLRISLALPHQSEKGETVTGTLSAQNAGWLPLQHIVCRVACTNRLTGETARHILPFALAPKDTADTAFTLNTAHCGRLAVSVSHVCVTDAFGLFARRLPLCEAQEILVLPTGFPLDLTIAPHMSAAVDSDSYSMTRPGHDPSEIYAIRAYIPGDPIRNIHWKLSQKSDSLLTRELALPVASQMLVLLETTVPAAFGNIDAAADAMVEVLAAVSAALCGLGIKHTLGWRDMETGLLRTGEITDADDLADALPDILANTFGLGDTTVAACFRSENELCAYAHAAVISPCAPHDLDLLRNGNRVTALVCGTDAAQDGLQADGTLRFTFSAKTYAHTLAGLEL